MPRVVVTALSADEKAAKVYELISSLAADLDSGGLDAIIVLTVVETAPGIVEERLRSVFDIVENEASIKILERWCTEARQLLRLHKESPGGNG